MEATGSVAQIHCHNAPKFVIPRSEATWESRGIMVDNRKAIGENATACTRLPRPLWGLAMTNLKACTLDEDAGQPATAKGAQGAPLQTQLVCTVLSAACTNCNCLHEIATSAAPPRNDKSGAVAVLTMACSEGQCLPKIATSACGLLAMTNLGACRIDCTCQMRAHSPTTTHHSRPQSKNTQKRRSHHVLYEMRKQDPG